MNSLTLFDYGTISDNLRRELVEDAAFIRGHQERVNDGVIAIGERLLAVKEKLPHGQFLKWVEAECGYGERSANDYMNIAKEFASNPHRGADLSLRAQRLLAAPSTPAEVKEIAYKKLDEGKSVTAAEIERLKRENADKEAAIKRAEREASNAKSEAERAKREAEAQKARATDLFDQVNVLKENAAAVRIKAEQDAEAKAAAERQRLLSEIDKAKAAAEQIRQEVEAAAKAQAEAAAQAELAKLDAEVKAARKREAEAKANVDRLREVEATKRKQIAEHQEYLSKIQNADAEGKDLLEQMRIFDAAVGDFSLVLGSLEYEHSGKVASTALTVADRCEKLARMLESIGSPRLRVVDIEAGAVNG